MSKQSITTTSGKTFTYEQSADLAMAIWHRFGEDIDGAVAAWNRMLQNNTSRKDFTGLLVDALSRLPGNEEVRESLQNPKPFSA